LEVCSGLSDRDSDRDEQITDDAEVVKTLGNVDVTENELAELTRLVETYGKHISFKAHMDDSDIDFELPVASFPSLPFSPGKYVERQHEDEIYRCAFKKREQVTRFVHLVKIFHRLNTPVHDGAECASHA